MRLFYWSVRTNDSNATLFLTNYSELGKTGFGVDQDRKYRIILKIKGKAIISFPLGIKLSQCHATPRLFLFWGKAYHFVFFTWVFLPL